MALEMPNLKNSPRPVQEQRRLRSACPSCPSETEFFAAKAVRREPISAGPTETSCSSLFRCFAFPDSDLAAASFRYPTTVMRFSCRTSDGVHGQACPPVPEYVSSRVRTRGKCQSARLIVRSALLDGLLCLGNRLRFRDFEDGVQSGH